MKKLIKSVKHKGFIILIIEKNASYYPIIKHEKHKTQLLLHSSITEDVRFWYSISEVIEKTKIHIDNHHTDMLMQIISYEQSLKMNQNGV